MNTKSPPREPQPSILVNLQDASVEYGPPYTSLRDLVVRGHLDRVRLPGSRRIWVRRADLERLIEQSVERMS